MLFSPLILACRFLCRKGLNFSNFLSKISDRIGSDLLAVNVFPAINVTLGPAILVLSLQNFNFQDPSLAERVVAY